MKSGSLPLDITALQKYTHPVYPSPELEDLWTRGIAKAYACNTGLMGLPASDRNVGRFHGRWTGAARRPGPGRILIRIIRQQIRMTRIEIRKNSKTI